MLRIILLFLIGSLVLNVMADSAIVISIAGKKFIAEIEDTVPERLLWRNFR